MKHLLIIAAFFAASCSKSKDEFKRCSKVAIVTYSTYTNQTTEMIPHDEMCGDALEVAKKYNSVDNPFSISEIVKDGTTYKIFEWYRVL